MKTHKFALLPGDGIGPEIIAEGKKVIEAAADKENFSVKWTEFPYGADHYLATKELVPEEAYKEMAKNEAIYLGALGDPRVAPGILEKGVLLALRFHFDEYINLRPIRLLEGVQTPLANKGPKDINFHVVRENTEDFYVGIGNRAKAGRNKQMLEVKRSLYSVKFGLDIDVEKDEIAYQIGVLSRKGSERVQRYAFELAKKKKKNRVTAVDKANVLTNVYSLWREVFEQVKKDYPGIETEYNFVDAITMWFVKQPEWYQVVVTPNMFGDIITDLGAMIQGGLGLAPGGNINPAGISMFEPIHGSAPKYKGMNRANPIATIWAGAMMLDEVGEAKAAEDIVKAIESVIKEGKTLTKDLGGTATTSDMGDAVVKKIGE